MTKTVTEEQIRLLYDEAEAAGDQEQMDLCEDALQGYEDAVLECARVIAEAATHE